MKLRWTILGLGGACAACCAPLIAPLLAGAGVGGVLALKTDGEAVACAGLAAAALGPVLLWAARPRPRPKVACDCPERCDLPLG